MKSKIRKIMLKLQTKIANYSFLIFFGLVLIFTKEEVLPRKGIGIFLIGIPSILLIHEFFIYNSIKKSKNSKNILIKEHKIIAQYLENNGIKYIYKPKDEKEFEFYLTEYDVYVKYWNENTNKIDRERLEKKVNRFDLKYMGIYYDKINSMQTLHGSFMKKLSMITKIR